MSKGLGPNQKKILACFDYLYKGYKHEYKNTEFFNIIRHNGIDTLICIILSLYYHIDIKNVENLPIKKKQAVYNAIDGLATRGWVIKSESKLTDSFINKPPVNYLSISAWIKDDQIYNFKKHRWKVLKHLIGATVL